MPRSRKATKRAASRRHRASTSAQRPSRNAAQPIVLTSASSASIRTNTPMKDTAITAPAPNSPLRTEPQDHHNAQAHQDRRAHSAQAALKERAFALACIGHRSPAIAARLGIPERTIRRWNRTTLRILALDATDASPDLSLTAGLDAPTTGDAGTAAPGDATPDTRSTTPDLMEYHRALAIERQLDIAVTARATYDRLMAQHDHLLAQYIAACDADIAATATVAAATPAVADEAAASPPLPAALASMARLIPQLASSASRQLQIAQAAHREVARLQGVTTYAQTDARLSAEYDVRQSLQAADPADEEGGHVPIHFFDPTAAIAAITGGLHDDDDDDEDDDSPTGAPPQNTSSQSAATSPAKSANDSGHISGHISGHNSGHNSGHISSNGTPQNAIATHSTPDPNTVW